MEHRRTPISVGPPDRSAFTSAGRSLSKLLVDNGPTASRSSVGSPTPDLAQAGYRRGFQRSNEWLVPGRVSPVGKLRHAPRFLSERATSRCLFASGCMPIGPARLGGPAWMDQRRWRAGQPFWKGGSGPWGRRRSIGHVTRCNSCARTAGRCVLVHMSRAGEPAITTERGGVSTASTGRPTVRPPSGGLSAGELPDG